MAKPEETVYCSKWEFVRWDEPPTEDVPAVAGPSSGVNALGHIVIDLTGIDDDDDDNNNSSSSSSKAKAKGKGKGPSAAQEVIDLTGDED